MSYTLWPHQVADSDLIAAGEHLPNYSLMGCGKSLTTLEAIRKLGLQRGVIVAPPIALPMWKAEIETYLGAKATILKTGASPLKVNSDFHVVSYGIAANPQMFQQLYSGCGGALVLDESHYLKTAGAKRTKAIYGPATTGRRGLFECFDQVLTLTGTPIVGNPSDLWAQLRATQPNALREHEILTYEQFLHKFCIVRLRKYHPRARPTMSVVATKNEELLNSILYNDIGCLRRSLKEVADSMPPITHRDIHVKPTNSRDLLAALKEFGTVEQLMEAMARGDEGIAKPWRLLGMSIAEEAADYIAEAQDALIAGYWHTDVGDALEERLKKAGKVVARIKGGVSSDDKVQIQERFNAGEIDVIVGQMGAMAVSLNLQKHAHRVVIVQDHFSPSVVDQFIGRIYRMGQKNHVQVDWITSDNEIATAIKTVRLRKEVTNEKVLDNE